MSNKYNKNAPRSLQCVVLSGPHYKVHCSKDNLRVDIVKQEDISDIYLQHLKEYPGNAHILLPTLPILWCCQTRPASPRWRTAAWPSTWAWPSSTSAWWPRWSARPPAEQSSTSTSSWSTREDLLFSWFVDPTKQWKIKCHFLFLTKLKTKFTKCHRIII